MSTNVDATWRATLSDLETKFIKGLRIAEKRPGDESVHAAALVERVFKVFGNAPDGSSTTADVAAAIKGAIDKCCEMASSAVLEGASREERVRIDIALKTLYYVNQAFGATMAGARMLLASTETDSTHGSGGRKGYDDDDAIVAGIARFSSCFKLDDDGEDTTNKIQQLLLYMLNCAQSKGFRRCNGDCYRRRYTSDGHDTHAWERVCTMQEFVYDNTRKEINYDMWLNLTSMRTNVAAAVDHLVNCKDVQMPDLVRDRHVFSFRNGIYLAGEDAFLPYGSARATALPASVASARFFDMSFDVDAYETTSSSDWYAIETPHLQSILDYQGMDDDVSRWMYVMIGRLIYEVNERDKWQVIAYLKGAASSGKSTILTRVCRGIYEASDVGVLSNNIERKFGLSAFYNKFMFIGPEMKSDVALEQAEFQSVVSGETVQVAIKFQTAQTVDWKVPGILAGNEVPGWVDNSGSINRRIVLFEFTKRVDDGDMELGKKLEGEMARLLLKCNRAYLHAVQRFAKDNLWKHLPKAFHRAKDDFGENVNSLVHFLRSGAFEFSQDNYMPLGDFTAAYKAYVERMGLTRLKSLSGDALTQPLMGARCYIKKNTTLKYPRGGSGVVTCAFLMGADMVCNKYGDDDDRDEYYSATRDDPLEPSRK